MKENKENKENKQNQTQEHVTVIYRDINGTTVKADVPFDAPLVPNTLVISI